VSKFFSCGQSFVTTNFRQFKAADLVELCRISKCIRRYVRTSYRTTTGHG